MRVADNKQRCAYILNRSAQIDLARGDASLALSRAEAALGLALTLDRPSEAALARAIIGDAAAQLGDRALWAQQVESLRDIPRDMLSRESVERINVMAREPGGGSGRRSAAGE